MSNTSFDPTSIFESYRNAFAPALKVQQEGIKAIDRVGRYQYAIAGDYLEWSLAQAKAALAAQSPAEFVSKQFELTTALSEKLRTRVQEFVTPDDRQPDELHRGREAGDREGREWAARKRPDAARPAPPTPRRRSAIAVLAIAAAAVGGDTPVSPPITV